MPNRRINLTVTETSMLKTASMHYIKCLKEVKKKKCKSVSNLTHRPITSGIFEMTYTSIWKEDTLLSDNRKLWGGTLWFVCIHPCNIVYLHSQSLDQLLDFKAIQFITVQVHENWDELRKSS